MTTPTQGGSRDQRSPNFPWSSLPAAIEDARALWTREKRTPVPPEVAARAWGYNSLSGPARSRIGALRQYGLVESVSGSLVLTDLAVEILVQPVGSEASNAAVAHAGSRPDLFVEIAQTHGDASDDALTAYLITKRKFSVDGAKRFIRSFRDTVNLVKSVVGGYNKAVADSPPNAETDMNVPSPVAVSQTVSQQGVIPLSFLLGEGVRAEVRLIGGPLSPKHFKKLGQYIELTGEGYGDSDEAN